MPTPSGFRPVTAAEYRLGLARAPGTGRVQPWAAGTARRVEGFSDERADAPFRRVSARRFSCPAPILLSADRLLIGFRSAEMKATIVLRILIGAREIGRVEVPAGAGLHVAEVSLGSSTDLSDRTVACEIVGSGRAVPSLLLRGIVAIDDQTRRTVGREITLGKGHLAGSTGLVLSDERSGGLVMKGERAVLALSIPEDCTAARVIHFDLWAGGGESGIWDVYVGGRRVLRLVGRAEPRAGKWVPRPNPLTPGDNRIEFRRISGGALHLETVRFIR